MIQKTKGLVVRSVKYGETSLIVTVFTELFGVQSYMVSGVRKEKSNSGMKPGLFQPGALLDLIVYHQERKNLQRIRECKWTYLYRNIFSDMYKNAVALFMVELLQKCLKQPDPQPELFYFMEDAFTELDAASPVVTANFPVFFALHLSHFFGFRMQDTYSVQKSILDLDEGLFVQDFPVHPRWTGEPHSFLISQFLKAQHPDDTTDLKMRREERRKLLEICLQFYTLHNADFRHLKSLPVLQTILD